MRVVTRFVLLVVLGQWVAPDPPRGAARSLATAKRQNPRPDSCSTWLRPETYTAQLPQTQDVTDFADRKGRIGFEGSLRLAQHAVNTSLHDSDRVRRRKSFTCVKRIACRSCIPRDAGMHVRRVMRCTHVTLLDLLTLSLSCKRVFAACCALFVVVSLQTLLCLFLSAMSVPP